MKKKICTAKVTGSLFNSWKITANGGGGTHQMKQKNNNRNVWSLDRHLAPDTGTSLSICLIPSVGTPPARRSITICSSAYHRTGMNAETKGRWPDDPRVVGKHAWSC